VGLDELIEDAVTLLEAHNAIGDQEVVRQQAREGELIESSAQMTSIVNVLG